MLCPCEYLPRSQNRFWGDKEEAGQPGIDSWVSKSRVHFLLSSAVPSWVAMAERNCRVSESEGRETPRGWTWGQCPERHFCTYPWVLGRHVCLYTNDKAELCSCHRKETPPVGLWHARNMIKGSDTVWKFQKETLTKADNTILIVGKQATRKLTFISKRSIINAPPTSVGNCGFTVVLYRCLRCALQVSTHVLTTLFIAKTNTLTRA